MIFNLSPSLCNVLNLVSGYIDTSAADGDFLDDTNINTAGTSFTFQPQDKARIAVTCDAALMSQADFFTFEDVTTTYAVWLNITDGGSPDTEPSDLTYYAPADVKLKLDVLAADTSADIIDKLRDMLLANIGTTFCIIDMDTAIMVVTPTAGAITNELGLYIEDGTSGGSFSGGQLSDGSGGTGSNVSGNPVAVVLTSVSQVKRIGNELYFVPNGTGINYLAFDMGTLFSLGIGSDFNGNMFCLVADNNIPVQEYSAPNLDQAIAWATEATASTMEILGLNTIGDVQLVYVTSDPSDILNPLLLLPDGSEFPQGSMAYANIAGVGRAYQKTAAAVPTVSTGWSLLASGVVPPAWELAGNALAGGEKFGSTNDFDVEFYRNDILRGKIIASGFAFGDFASGVATIPEDTAARFVQQSTYENLTALDFNNGVGSNRPYIIERGKCQRITTIGSPGNDYVYQYKLPDINCVCEIEIDILAKTVSGGTPGEVFMFRRVYTVRNIADTATIRQTASPFTYKDVHDSLYFVSANIMGGAGNRHLEVRGNQAAGKVIDWFSSLKVKVYIA
jgi:hypothetical protein